MTRATSSVTASLVAAALLAACRHDPQSGGYCWHYRSDCPTTCGWDVSCEVHPLDFPQLGAVICPAGEQCYDGRTVEDAAVFCPDDLLGSDDLRGPDDLGSPDDPGGFDELPTSG